jgi:excisionase family DNA binding protein
MLSERLVWSAEELARLLGVTPKAIYAMTSKQRLPCVRVGRRLFFPRGLIEKWLSEQAQGGERP